MYYEEKIQSQFAEDFGFQLWDEVDREQKAHGVVLTGEMPSRYFRSLIDDEEREVKEMRHNLDTNQIHPNRITTVRADIIKREARLAQLREARAGLTPHQIDKIKMVYENLSNLISETMPTYSEMHKGTADAAKEAIIMTDQVVGIPHRPTALFVKACCGDQKVGMRNGKFYASRNSLSKAWKMAGFELGEPTNTEVLRKDEYDKPQRHRPIVISPENPIEPTVGVVPEKGVAEDTPQKNTAERPTLEPETGKPERTCMDCGVDISDRHHFAKTCLTCKEERKKK